MAESLRAVHSSGDPAIIAAQSREDVVVATRSSGSATTPVRCTGEWR